MRASLNAYSQIRKVVAVSSGKGGVGKSSVTAMLAVLMARRGYKVGILDADITGPSIPAMFGVHQQIYGNQDGILPAASTTGIEMISVNLVLERESTPVLWRGPVISGTVKQFYSEVVWRDIDCMLVDMPPGTGDVPLTVFQSLPLDGVIIVATPQELVGMVVSKAIEMARMMDIPILGIVQNMSYVRCPDCGKQIYVFGQVGAQAVAEQYALPLLAQVPMDPALSALCDAGRIEYFDGDWLDGAITAVESASRE